MKRAIRNRANINFSQYARNISTINNKEVNMRYKEMRLLSFFLVLNSICILFAQDIKSDPIYAIAVSPQNPEIMYAGSKDAIYKIESDECFRSTPTTGRFLYLAVDPTNSQRIFATAKINDITSEVLTTNDGGESWSRVSIPKIMKYGFMGYEYSVGHYGPIIIDHLNPAKISIGAECRYGELESNGHTSNCGCIISSTDSGKSWRISGILNIDWKEWPNPIYSFLSDSKTLILSTPDGLFRNGEYLKNSPRQVGSLVFSSNFGKILAATLDGRIYATFAIGDKPYLLANTRKKINCLLIDPQKPKVLWIGTDNGLFKSTDDGTNWEKTGNWQIESKTIYCLATNPADNQLLYCGTNKGLYVSENQGASWQIFKTPIEKRLDILYSQAESLEKQNEESKAVTFYKQILDSFPSLELTKVVRQRYQRLTKILDARNRIASVSEEKARSAIGRLGLSESESNSLAYSVNNLSRNYVLAVIVNGLEMPLKESEAWLEYQKMSLYQKLYVILYAAENLASADLDPMSSKQSRLKEWLYLSDKISEKMVRIKSESLLVK